MRWPRTTFGALKSRTGWLANIARLRGVFDDALFVRAGSEMKPTPKALELAPPRPAWSKPPVLKSCSRQPLNQQKLIVHSPFLRRILARWPSSLMCWSQARPNWQLGFSRTCKRPGFFSKVCWHRRMQHDPANKWLRGVFHAVNRREANLPLF